MDENIVKRVCRELGITQKELARKIGVAENTVSQWARGIVETPKWALKMFELLKKAEDYDRAKRIFCDSERTK